MTNHRTHRQSWLATGALVLLLACLATFSYGNPCQPPTPSPCAADGVCRPNRATWGFAHTRWRQWPGDPASAQPTPADSAAGDEETPQLPGYEPPLPEEEDLRGPAKEAKPKDDEDDAAEVQPLDGAVQPLPGPGNLPDFDPQGNLQTLPPVEDAPPALPESLRRSAAVFQLDNDYTQREQNSFVPLPLPTQVAAPVPTAEAKLINPASNSVQQATWQRPSDIALVNPASAIVVQPEDEPLQQAIYYEASEEPQSTTTK